MLVYMCVYGILNPFTSNASSVWSLAIVSLLYRDLMSGRLRAGASAARQYARSGGGMGSVPRAAGASAPASGSARVQAQRARRALARAMCSHCGGNAMVRNPMLQPQAGSSMLDAFLYASDEFDDT